MKKQQIIVIAGGLVLLFGLFFFGKTVPKAKTAPAAANAAADHQHQHTIDFPAILAAATKKLSPTQQAYVKSLETAVVRGDVNDQQVHVYHQLAAFWRDSARSFEPYAYYTAEAAKLENSEKKLTFAARLFLDNLRQLDEPGLRAWEANQAKVLFEKALALNPSNDSAKIGLGSCYIFGGEAGNPQETMQGIQQILEVARRDPKNMYAQLMLGIGGMVSGQYDKAAERLLNVVHAEPKNLEAVFMLAEAYEKKGDKTDAIKWYKVGKQQVPNPEIVKEIDKRIELLSK